MMKQAKSKMKLRKILVVDDDPKMRKILSEFLSKYYNFQIIEAEDGLDAISKTFKHKFNVVISDLEMPEMNGLEFMGYLKTISDYDRIPKFFMTSNKKNFNKEKAKKIGVNTFLSKPLNSTELKNVLDKLF
ncbi:response regulator [candidate division KSB1 bacterium]